MTDTASLYDTDFVRWAEEQAVAVRAASASGTNLPLDRENIAAEIASLGKSLRRELRDRLATIIEHLFKLEMADVIEPRRGWIETVQRERLEIEALLDENPSLRADLASDIVRADATARRLVEVSFVRSGEWSPERREELSQTRFPQSEVFGPQVDS